MRRTLVASSAVVLIALTALAMPAAGYTFALNYSDPASDVVQLWSSNMTPVEDRDGTPLMSPFPTSINILWIRSEESGLTAENVTVAIEAQGNIANLDNTSYEVRMYTRADNASHFIVTYVNGTMTLDSNATGYTPVDISGNHTITAAGPNPTLRNLLRMTAMKSLLGTITDWNIDATTTQRGPVYTYQDFGWQVPGNPGSSPTVLRGVVREAGSGAVLAGVTVGTDVGGYTATTNATGGYSIALVPGTYNVTFSLDGYVAQTVMVTIASGETRDLNAQLSRVGLVGDAGLLTIIAFVAVLAIVGLLFVVYARRRRGEAPPRT